MIGSLSRQTHVCLGQLIVTLFLLSAVTCATTNSPSCTSPKHHPFYSDDITPVMVKCWTYLTAPRIPRTVYLARYSKHSYAPISDLSSNTYDKLDWFWSTSGHGNTDDFIMLHFNRPGRVYFAIPIHKNSKVESPTLPGWEPKGELQLVKGIDEPFDFGVYQTYTAQFKLSERVYVFMKEGSDVQLPHLPWVKNELKGFSIPNGKSGIAFISEMDGKKWQYPPNPPNVMEAIEPNKECPSELHDMWVTPNTDDDDEHTRGKMWKTWHPLWDPVYWCSYAHEHGSSPIDLMGYWPKYDYTAFKNNNQDESNAGFKTLCLRTKEHTMCYTVHMQTSNLRRISVRFHTIQLVVVHRKTGRIVVELTHKGDFGALTARMPNARFMALSNEDEIIMKENFKAPKRRSINIISPDGKLDSRLQYRSPLHTISMGTYEDWTTVPVCGAGGRRGNLRSDVTRSATGIPSMDRKDEKVYLGRKDNGHFYRQAGQARILLAKNFSLSSDDCGRMLGKGAVTKSGVFYTDPMGKELRDGSGKTNIRQYVEPGFRIDLNGEYRPIDTFTGLMELHSELEMEDLGFGIDPDLN